jgi:hypothetical protein
MKKTFLKQNGWMHWLVFLYVAYTVMYWGLSQYGIKTVEWPTSMVNSFASQSLFAKLILGFAGGFLLNLVYEFLALKVAQISVSLWDCFWAGIGFMCGVLLYEAFPQNKYIFYLTFGQLIGLAAFCLSLLIEEAKRNNH